MENRINQQNSAYENLKVKTNKLQKEIEGKKSEINKLLLKNQQIIGEKQDEN